MNDQKTIDELRAKLLEYAKIIGAVQGTLSVVVDLDRPVFVNTKLKELQVIVENCK